MLKARLIFPLSELQCRKVLLLSEKCNKRSDFYCLKIKNIPEGLRLAGISESPEPKLGSKWGQSAGFGSWGCSSPAARHFRAPNLLAKHPKKKKIFSRLTYQELLAAVEEDRNGMSVLSYLVRNHTQTLSRNLPPGRMWSLEWLKGITWRKNSFIQSTDICGMGNLNTLVGVQGINRVVFNSTVTVVG